MTAMESSDELPVLEMSPHESRVLTELCRDGAAESVIAKRLGITIWQVHYATQKLCALTGTHSRTALAVKVLRKEVRLSCPELALRSVK